MLTFHLEISEIKSRYVIPEKIELDFNGYGSINKFENLRDTKVNSDKHTVTKHLFRSKTVRFFKKQIESKLNY